MLQLTVFPKLKDDPSVILNLKIIHFVVSVVVIAVSFWFIELVSKKMTLPLVELTKTGGSDKPGGRGSPCFVCSVHGQWLDQRCIVCPDDQIEVGDEISQLTSSFNRMIAHLKASEMRLRESEEKYRFLFDNGPFPKFVIDAETMR